MDRYRSLGQYFREKYGQKVGKLSLDAGFSCPNRDGSISYKGCIFCSEKGSGDFTSGNISLKAQMKDQKEIVKKKWKNTRYIAYFQNFTNTYGEVDYLKKIYNQVLEEEDIVGIAIATRADCLEEPVLDLLEDISSKTDLWIEIGMQSKKEETIKFINRGYSHQYLDKKLKELNRRKIPFLLHIIFGLPGESSKDMMESIEYVNGSGAFGVKIHSLYIQDDSPIYEEYLKGQMEILSKDQYTDLVVEAIGRLEKDIVVHRITGDGDRSKLVAPKWSGDKLRVIGEINRKLRINDIRQGCLMEEE